MGNFILSWPDAGRRVRCIPLEENAAAAACFAANLPVRVLQGHEMTGGWMLHDRCIPLRQQAFRLAPETLAEERMCDAPVGRVALLSPRGGMTELVVKYDECADTRAYIPIAQVAEEDIPALRAAGQAQWAASTRSKAVIFAEFTPEED